VYITERRREEMKKRKRLIYFGSLIGLVVALMLCGGFALAAQKSVSIPKMMTWTCYEVGTSLYLQVGYVGETLFEKYGVKIRVIPAAADIPRVYPVRLKDAEVAFHGFGTYFMQEGLEDYSSMEWGPQPIRALYYGQHAGLPLYVRGDSDIRTVADLRGKRVAAFPTRSLTLINEIHLVFAGMTWDDVVKVMVPSYTTAIRMVKEGKLDATILNPTAPLAYEMEAMPGGLRFIPMPADDKEGWGRVKKQVPACVSFKATIGAGLSEEKPLETVSYAYPVGVAYDFLPEEKAYVITKLLVESYPEYAKKHKSLKAYWNPDSVLFLTTIRCHFTKAPSGISRKLANGIRSAKQKTKNGFNIKQR
jgi:TRAP transporter TAXI family solute receptor